MSKSQKEVEVAQEPVHQALLAGFRAIIRKAHPNYGYKLYSTGVRGWTLAVTHPRISGDCILYIEEGKLIIGINKKTVLELCDPKMDTQVVPAVRAAFNPPAGSLWRQ